MWKTQGERLRWARIESGYRSAAAFARDADVPEVTYRAHERDTRGLSEAAARQYAALLRGVSWAWLVTGEGDPFAPTERAAAPAPHPARPGRAALPPANVDPRSLRGHDFGPRDLEVYASAEGGPDGMLVTPEPIDRIARPEAVLNVRDAFAVYVVGDSMEPRIEHGEMVVVNPARPVRRRDDVVLVRVRDDGSWSALVKRIVSWTAAEWVVEQYNPPMSFALSRQDWPIAYPIVTRAAS